MSHAATNWAIAQRGLKPATKIVLWHLADCHNPSNGCFPSQDYLSDRCEMSRSSLNEHLATLESLGLIRREQRRDTRTRKQENTRYHLAFEDDFGPNPSPKSGHGSSEPVSGNPQKPCPENGESRVQNPDTNPVREPVTEPFSAQERERENSKSGSDEKQIERWLKRHHPSWPSYITDSGPKALKAALTLGDDERQAAVDRLQDYVASANVGGRTMICTFGVYLSEKRWEKLPPAMPKPFDEYATPFSKPWGAWILGHLLTSEDQAAKGWPLLAGLYRMASARQGHRFAKRWHDLGADFEPVPVGSAMFAAWQAHFAQMGWPWFPDPGDQPVVFFPKGGPQGLEAFKAVVAGEGGEHDGGRREAAE